MKLKLFRRKDDPPPDEGTWFYALAYAVSLRQRRNADGFRAFSWLEIHAQSAYPGSVDECIIDVTLRLDELERLQLLKSQWQREGMTVRVTPRQSDDALHAAESGSAREEGKENDPSAEVLE